MIVLLVLVLVALSAREIHNVRNPRFDAASEDDFVRLLLLQLSRFDSRFVFTAVSISSLLLDESSCLRVRISDNSGRRRCLFLRHF